MLGFILLLLLTGLIFGALGRLIIPGPNPMSIPMTILVGIGGALLGGLVVRALFNDADGPGLIVGSLCAALIVWLLDRTGVGARLQR